MSRRFLTPIDLVQNELRNAVIQVLAADPENPVVGQVYYNSTDKVLTYFDGTVWVRSSIPAGPAGGDLEGAYPSPQIAAELRDLITGAEQTASKGQADGYAPLGADALVPLVYLPVADNGESSETEVVRADDARLSDPRAPLPGSVRDEHIAADAAIAHEKIAPPIGDVDFAGHRLTGVGEPTASSDAATKRYVDTLSQGLDFKSSARVATAADLAGAYSGAGGGTITGTGALRVDGVTVAAGDRVLVKDQTAGAENGIYTVSEASGSAWTLTRSEDANAQGELTTGAVLWIDEGASNGSKLYVLMTKAPITLGTTALSFTTFGGAITPMEAGAGLYVTDGWLMVGAGSGITVTADAVAIDTAVVVRKFLKALTGGATSEVVTHNLATRDVTVAVVNNTAPYDEVYLDVEHTDLNTVTVRATQPLPAGYRVIIHG